MPESVGVHYTTGAMVGPGFIGEYWGWWKRAPCPQAPMINYTAEQNMIWLYILFPGSLQTKITMTLDVKSLQLRNIIIYTKITTTYSRVPSIDYITYTEVLASCIYGTFFASKAGDFSFPTYYCCKNSGARIWYHANLHFWFGVRKCKLCDKA
jgi:hypothetical protein